MPDTVRASSHDDPCRSRRNATIEAVRAGEMSKVAAEVKTPANQTARVAEAIESQIGSIQAAIETDTMAQELLGATQQLSEEVGARQREGHEEIVCISSGTPATE